MIGGTGAHRHRDGVDTGGHTWDPKSSGANAEENELLYPMLYLSREELTVRVARASTAAATSWSPASSPTATTASTTR